MLAFQNAVRWGVDALEIDIHASRDGVLVVAHDPVVDRVSNGHGAIRDKTLAELREYDFGYQWTADHGRTFPFRGQGVTIPTLEELLAAFPQMWINVDIKQTDPPIVPRFVEQVRRHGLARNICVGSFDNGTVREFRRQLPQAATAASINEVRRMVMLNRMGLGRLFRSGATAFQIPETHEGTRVVDPQFIQAAQRGLWRQRAAVHIWTVDAVADMQRLMDWGVDGLITDYPDRLLKRLGRRERSLDDGPVTSGSTPQPGARVHDVQAGGDLR